MKFLRTIASLGVLILAVTSCATQVSREFTPIPQSTIEYLWDHPIPTPSFVETLTTDAGKSGFEQDVCVGIREGAVWERGDFGSDVYSRIQETAIVRVNGQPVSALVFYQSTIILFEYDSQNQPIGSYGGGVSVCFDVKALPSGIHLVAIDITAKSGVHHSHTWAFKIP